MVAFLIGGVLTVEKAQSIVEKIFGYKFIANKIANLMFLALPLVLFLLVLFELNKFYCDFLLERQTAIVDGRMEKEELIHRHQQVYKEFYYEYSFNSDMYYNKIEKSELKLGDYLQIKVSVFDPTVCQIL